MPFGGSDFVVTWGRPYHRVRAARFGAFFLLLVATLAHPASALEIELGDMAPDRVERQRAYSRGALPLPGTPDVARLDARLAAKGLKKGNPVYIRIFKESSELELWMRNGDAYVLLDTYPICHWTGTLGPKLREGDKQSPEGFYTVSNRQMRTVGRWPRAFNLGFPNAYDQANKRTGSYILIHGGCSSTGCFAMTEAVQDEIYALADAALDAGQARFSVHVFPFRMTENAMAAHAGHAWAGFWRDLKPAYDAFERTRVPPNVALCGQRYHVSDGDPADTGRTQHLPSLRPQTIASAGSEAACIPDEPGRDGRALTTSALPDTEAREKLKGRNRQAVQRTTRASARPQQNSAPVETNAREMEHNGLGNRIERDGLRINTQGG
jgi:murein L,D-transpeptidase YafK